MQLLTFPFKYYSLLPDTALATRIREESWTLDKLFPFLNETKRELNRLRHSAKSNSTDIYKIRHIIELLAKQLRFGFQTLKRINFHDSALFYLYYKLLKYLLDLCRKEHSKLTDELNAALSKEINIKKASIENIKLAKEEIEKNIKKHESLIKGFDAASKELVKAYEKLVEELRKHRWDTEKQAQHEFALLKITLRSMKNLNRKIKVEAIKVKTKIIPQKILLMKKIRRQAKHEDILKLAKLVSQAISRVSKDILYSAKLIAKFESEMLRLNRIVENLKKEMNHLVQYKKIDYKSALQITKLWDEKLKNLKEETDRDLMEIFRNNFVEYKFIGTRKLAA